MMREPCNCAELEGSLCGAASLNSRGDHQLSAPLIDDGE